MGRGFQPHPWGLTGDLLGSAARESNAAPESVWLRWLRPRPGWM